MDQYEEWQEEDGTISRKYPIHNYYNSPIPTRQNYIPSRMISSNYQKIYPSPGQIIQTNKEIVNEGFNNFIISDSDPNLLSDNYDYPQYSYENNQNIVYSNQYYNTDMSNNMNYNNSHSSTNITNSSLRKYESSDGVLRGYTNNYSFYVSGSSQVKPKVTINNQYNNKNYNNITHYQNKNININQNQNKSQYIYQNITSPQKKSGHYQRIIYPNNYSNISNVNSNYGINQNNRQNENTSYIIRMAEKEPIIYNRQTQQYNNRNNNMNYNNYNNYNNKEEIYYFKQNDNRNIKQGTYQGPLIQRRMVKRVVDREPMDSRKDYYMINPRDNLRNRMKNNQYNNITNITNRSPQKPLYQKINNEPNNDNFRKFYSGNLNNRIININQRNNYFAPNPLKRTNTPNAPRSNISYSRPLISRQQRIVGNSPNYYGFKNANNSISYQEQGNRYNDYIDRTDYLITQTESNSPRNNNFYISKSPYIRNDNNNIYGYSGRRERQREYVSRTEFPNQNQTEYEVEYEKADDDDDVYEVPEQFSNRGYYEEKRQNYERPFTRISNYSQTERDGRKYGVYTQNLVMNKNYNYDDEYEVDKRDIRYVRDNNNYRNNYSVPKIMKPISEVQRLLRQKREYSAFERSLKNIRDNEEEIELENEERDNRVKIKTSGSNNHRLYISEDSKGRSSRKYKTHTELQTDNRHEGYVLQDIDDSNQDDFMYQNNRNKRKIIKNNNLKIVQRGNERISPSNSGYHPEENSNFEEENMQNIDNNTRNNEEIEDEDNDENDKMYDTNQLIATKEDNYRIVQNNQINQRREEEFSRPDQIRNTEENEQIRDNEIEGEEHEEIIQQTNTNTNTNTDEDLYQRDDVPQDRDEAISTGNKNLKNIQTEINEKYYDNQGNYLGEKKIITTEQIPVNSQNQREEFSPQKEEGEYQDDQEEQEDNENENEYIPYQSNNKQFKKRGENKNIIESKYHSYFGDSNNNVYYEIKGVSGEINKEEESKNEEEVEKRNYKEPMVEVKNVNFGIQSENLCVPGQGNDNDNEEKHNIEDKDNNDEKEADEQQIDENVVIEEEEEEEEQNNINENKESNENLDNQEIEENLEKRDNFEEKIEENPENNEKIEEIQENVEQKENYEYNMEDNQENIQNRENLLDVEKSQNIEENFNVENSQHLNEEQNIKRNENEYDNDINKMKNETNKIELNVEENELNKNNENIYKENEKENEENNNNIDENVNYINNTDENVDNNNIKENDKKIDENDEYANNNNIDGNVDINNIDKQESINNLEENIEINNNDEMNLNNNNYEVNNNSNVDENNIYISNNENMNENNYDYNEEEQIIVENEAEEMENKNIQKDEGEENIDEGLVEMEENYEGNYEENEMVEGEEEGQEEYNEIENENINKEEEENINKEEEENEQEN